MDEEEQFPEVERFIEDMCEAVPALRPILELERSRGYSVSMMTMGEMTRVAKEWHLAELRDPSRPSKELREMFAFLESRYPSSTEQIRMVIDEEFLENLKGPADPQWRIRELLGPALRKRIEVIWSSKHPWIRGGWR